MFCIVITDEKNKATIGPFNTAQEAAQFIEKKFTPPIGASCVVIPMMAPGLWKEDKPAVLPKMEIEAKGRHTTIITVIADWNIDIYETPQGVRIRVDDKSALDFWLELLIKDHALIKLK